MRISKIDQQKRKVQTSYQKGKSIVTETTRVASVLENIDSIVDNLDKEFTQKTGITNKVDLSFLFVAVMLQTLRWIALPGMKLTNIEEQSPQIKKEDRLKSDEENHVGKLYEGMKSGRYYEDEEIRKYTRLHRRTRNDSYKEYSENLKGRQATKYRTWIEILKRPVPYDAMFSDGRGNIPSISGLNNFDLGTMKYKNITGTNHHVATLGHDPVLGWVFGTMNIMSNTISLVTYESYGVRQIQNVDGLFIAQPDLKKWLQRIDYSDYWLLTDIIRYCIASFREDNKRLPAAVVRQSIHFASDKYCVEGLPIPLLSSIDAERAQELIEKGWNSEEFGFLAKGDIFNIGLKAGLSMIINMVLYAIYLLCFDSGEESIEIRKVRIRKVLLISNLITSTSNIVYTAISRDVSKVDPGGIGVTLLNLFMTPSFIRKVKEEYIAKGIEKEILGDSTWYDIALQETYKNEE